jgi:hypothetical protein
MSCDETELTPARMRWLGLVLGLVLLDVLVMVVGHASR